MSTKVETKRSDAEIRVALIIEYGKIRPVWFELTDRPSQDRIYIKQICYRWTYLEGRAKIISFTVWDGANTYCLSLNTADFTWRLGVAVEEPFPSCQPF